MRIFIVILGLISFYQVALSQTTRDYYVPDDTTIFPDDFFDSNEPFEITLKFDIKKFKKEKSDEEYLPAKLIYHSNAKVITEKSVRIKARGEYRRNYCILPPFWINIKHANISNDNLSDVNKIKVVTHCKDLRAYRSNLLKEYLAYKIYNIITDYSFRVRLVSVKYVDTGRKNKVSEELAFMIEPEDLLSERLDAYPLEIDKVKYSQTDSVQTTIMSVFQYMIGNTDYSVSGRHNLKLITLKDYTKPEIIAIPYDFDFSGLVFTDYARPSPKIGIKSVTERYYYGMCRSDKLYQQVLDLFLSKKDEIFNMIDEFDLLDKKTRKYVVNYIEEFYKETEEDKFIKNHFRITCE